MIAYRVEVWCDGDCFTRFLKTTPTNNPVAMPQLALDLSARAACEGWTADGTAIFCPACTRQRNDEDKAQSVVAFKEKERRSAARGAR
jgi:hypothetical protein